VTPDILSFAKGVTSGYLPLGGIMVTRAIKEVMDSVKPDDRWMHAYTYSGHPTCCAVALKNIEIMERDRLSEYAAKMGEYLQAGLTAAFGNHPNTGDIRSGENAAKMGERLRAGLTATFSGHPNTGDIRGGKGLLAAVEFVEDRPTRKNFPSELKFAASIRREMMNRGVVTRTRPAVGPDPAPGDILFIAPPLVITEAEIDRLVSVARDAVDAVLGVST
jgi:adenosylmethionine-8-amino-7-oxononanoate aminotransferase